MAPAKLPRGLPLVFIISLVLSLAFTWVFVEEKCDMEGRLTPLFAYTTSILNSINAEYWIDYGTLLGGIREKRLLAHEFDLDLATREEECPKIISALKERVRADGFHPYERGEWIEQKYNRVLGTDGYMHKPCFRIYDANHVIYVDIDWYKTYSPAQVAAVQAATQDPSSANFVQHSTKIPSHMGGDAAQRSLHGLEDLTSMLPKRPGGLDIPQGYQPHEALLCNEEGIDGGDPGGCRAESWMLPLKPFTFANGIKSLIPAQAEKNLEAMYGADWMIPRGKGYKLALCGWFPRTTTTCFFLVITVMLLPSLIYLAAMYARQHGLHALSQRMLLQPQYSRLHMKVPEIDRDLEDLRIDESP